MMKNLKRDINEVLIEKDPVRKGKRRPMRRSEHPWTIRITAKTPNGMLPPAQIVLYVSCNLNYGPDLGVQVTENTQQVTIYCLREAAKVKAKGKRSL